MSKNKKQEGPGKPRNAVYVTLNKELREQLEAEQARRGGSKAGVKLAQILREKVTRQLECERKGAPC